MGIEASRLLAVIDGDATGAIRAYEAAERKGTSSAAAMGKVGAAAQTAIAVGVGAVAVAFGMAVNTAMDFDRQMSSVQAKAGATQADFTMLREQALKLGADTVFSSSQAAKGMDNLAAAGFTAQQIFEAMPGVTYAAIAAGGDFASTAEIMAATMQQFKYEASDMPRIGDIMAKAANVSAASITDLGVSMRYAGPVAATLGLSLEETTATLALMANQGFKSDMAGTALRMGLMRLANIGPVVEKRLGKVGKGLQDGLRSAPTLAAKLDLLRSKMEGMSRADKVGFLQKLVGTEAAPAFLALLSQSGTALSEMTTQMYNADGAAKQAGDTMINNFYGSMLQLRGSVESAGIAIGTALTPQIRSMTDGITGAINKFSALTPAQQQAAIQNVALAAAFAGGALAAVKLAQGIIVVSTAMQVAAGPVGLLWAAVGILGGVAAGAVTNQLLFGSSLNGTASAADNARSAAEGLKKAIDDLNGVKLDETEAELGVRVAQAGVKSAGKNTKRTEKTYGKGSDEAKNAKNAEEQASITLTRAEGRLAEAKGKRIAVDNKAEAATVKNIAAIKAESAAAFTKGLLDNKQAVTTAQLTQADKKATEQTRLFGQALANAGVSPTVAASIGAYVGKTHDISGAAGEAQAKVDALHKKLAATPKSKKAEVKVEIAKAEAELAKIKAAIAAVKDKTVTVNVDTWQRTFAQTVSGVYPPKKKARGDRVPATYGGSLSILAEAGVPEYAIPMDKSARSLALWTSAGHELGALGKSAGAAAAQVVNQFTGPIMVNVPDGKVKTFMSGLGGQVSSGRRRVALGG